MRRRENANRYFISHWEKNEIESFVIEPCRHENRVAFVLDADDEVAGVVVDLVGRALPLEVEGPQRAGLAALREEFRIEVEDAARRGLLPES